MRKIIKQKLRKKKELNNLIRRNMHISQRSAAFFSIYRKMYDLKVCVTKNKKRYK